MQTSTKAIRAAIEAGEISAEGLQPSVIFSREIDHAQAVEYTSCHVNDSWAPAIKEKISEGFIVFRIQSEFNMGIGHVTMAYMAKLKTN